MIRGRGPLLKAGGGHRLGGDLCMSRSAILKIDWRDQPATGRVCGQEAGAARCGARDARCAAKGAA